MAASQGFLGSMYEGMAVGTGVAVGTLDFALDSSR